MGEVARATLMACRGTAAVWPDVTGKTARFRLEVTCYFADGRRRDWDNVAKSVADGLNGVGYRDDTQVIEFAGSKHVDPNNPRTEVCLEVLPWV